MDEPITSLANKITRDFAYPIGGGSIMGSLWLTFIAGCNIGESTKELSAVPTIVFLLFFGISYVIGFICQEVFSFIPGFSTTLKIDRWKQCFRRIMICLYRLYTREAFSHATGFAENSAIDLMNSSGFEALKNIIDRTATLQHIGTSIGPCFIVSGFILFFSPLCVVKISGAVIALLGVFLWIVIGRLKTMQQIYYYEQLDCKINKQ